MYVHYLCSIKFIKSIHLKQVLTQKEIVSIYLLNVIYKKNVDEKTDLDKLLTLRCYLIFVSL